MRRLSPGQRYVLKNLVERDGKARSVAIYSLGYWAACRVSDVSWLKVEDAYLGPNAAWSRAAKAREKGAIYHPKRQERVAPVSLIQLPVVRA